MFILIQFNLAEVQSFSSIVTTHAQYARTKCDENYVTDFFLSIVPTRDCVRTKAWQQNPCVGAMQICSGYLKPIITRIEHSYQHGKTLHVTMKI